MVQKSIKISNHWYTEASIKVFFTIRVINIWSSLPQSVIDATSTNQFKNMLDRHFSNIMYDL